jgi:hypothetical protein
MGGFELINRELAEKLKDAGLEWEPEFGDFAISETCNSQGIAININKYNKSYLLNLLFDGGFMTENTFNCLWLPRLDQLLAEIGRHGYKWDIGDLGGFGEHADHVCIGLFNGETREYVKGQFYADNPEDAAAKALLWILEEGAGKVTSDDID